MTDHDRISRLEALLARVKARTDAPRAADGHAEAESEAPAPVANGVANGASHEEPQYLEAGQTHGSVSGKVAPEDIDHVSGLSRPDSVFPPESSTLHALPPPPPDSSGVAFSAPDSSPQSSRFVDERPISKPISQSAPTPLEEAFEQYEMVQEVVEISPDAEDDAVHPSELPPLLLDEVVEEEAAARVRANELSDAPFSEPERGYGNVPAPAEEFQSQQRLVAAPSSRSVSGVDESELEVLGEADLEEDLSELIDVEDRPARHSQPELDHDYGAQSTQKAEEMIATILANGIEAPPENANRPVLELQEEDDEPPPSSRRPVSHELATSSALEPHEQELTFDDPPPLMTPPPESGRQVALPDLSSDAPDAFAASFSGVREESEWSPSLTRADLDDNSGVAVVVEPSAPGNAATFGELIDLALSI